MNAKRVCQVIVLCSLWAHVAPTLRAESYSSPQHAADDGSNFPSSIKAFLPAVQSRASANLQQLHDQDAVTLTPGFKLTFWQPTFDYRNPSSSAWLLGYQLGTDGNYISCVVALVDNQGTEILRIPLTVYGRDFPFNDSYDYGLIVQLSNQVFALVASAPAGKRSGSEIVILSVQAHPTVLFTYKGPDPDPFGDTSPPSWESTLYFADVDGDDVKEMLMMRMHIHRQQTPRLYLTSRRRKLRLVQR